jgi:hypothetical protein
MEVNLCLKEVMFTMYRLKGFKVTRWLFFCCGEGPRSRSYGRTAALRLFVQPFDEDEVDQFSFSIFKVLEYRWNESDRVKPKYSGKNLFQCQFVHHKSHMD